MFFLTFCFFINILSTLICTLGALDFNAHRRFPFIRIKCHLVEFSLFLQSMHFNIVMVFLCQLNGHLFDGMFMFFLIFFSLNWSSGQEYSCNKHKASPPSTCSGGGEDACFLLLRRVCGESCVIQTHRCACGGIPPSLAHGYFVRNALLFIFEALLEVMSHSPVVWKMAWKLSCALPVWLESKR